MNVFFAMEVTYFTGLLFMLPTWHVIHEKKNWPEGLFKVWDSNQSSEGHKLGLVVEFWL